jgi:uncharacterized protein
MKLSTDQVCCVRRALEAVLPGAEVWVFGSRATGRSRPFSDLDLLLTWPDRLSWAQRAALRDAFDESELPFRVDVVEAAVLSPALAQRVNAEKVLLRAD